MVSIGDFEQAQKLYIGLMSGTSMDGIDAVLVDLSVKPPILLATYHQPLPPSLKQELLSLCQPGNDEINRMAQLDNQLGFLFAEAVNSLISKSKTNKAAIKAIGSHGQTIRHAPKATSPFTLQIANPNIIAAETDITTIADFRRKDIACGGEGAPLVPAFHAWMFHSDQEDRAIINIGGIANITILYKDVTQPTIGFDLGPGNTLLDSWIHYTCQRHYDDKGLWAASGQVHTELLQLLLADPYFQIDPPKSTGREYFNLAWLQRILQQYEKTIKPTDVQTTLVELTSVLIGKTLQRYLPHPCAVMLCGGGTYNDYLCQRIDQNAPGYLLQTTTEFGIEPQWIEATAFAWLAKQTLAGLPSNVPSVTGASRSTILGGIYLS